MPLDTLGALSLSKRLAIQRRTSHASGPPTRSHASINIASETASFCINTAWTNPRRSVDAEATGQQSLTASRRTAPNDNSPYSNDRWPNSHRPTAKPPPNASHAIFSRSGIMFGRPFCFAPPRARRGAPVAQSCFRPGRRAHCRSICDRQRNPRWRSDRLDRRLLCAGAREEGGHVGHILLVRVPPIGWTINMYVFEYEIQGGRQQTKKNHHQCHVAHEWEKESGCSHQEGHQ